MVELKVNLNCLVIEIKNFINSKFGLYIMLTFIVLILCNLIFGNALSIIFSTFTFFVIFLAVTVLFLSIGYTYGKYLFKKNNCLDKRKKHHGEYAAVLISNSSSSSMVKNKLARWQKNRVVDTFTFPLYFLKKSFDNRKVDYVFRQKITEEDLDYFVQDHMCQELYLVGHGSRGSFATTDNRVSYSKYQDTCNKKRVISQMHCNYFKCDKEKNLSLTEILAFDKNNSYLSKGFVTYGEIMYYCIKQWCKSKYIKET